MTNWVTSYVSWLFRFRWLSLLAIFAVTAAGFSGLQHARFKGDYRVFFGPDNPQLAAHDKLERTYTKADNILFIIQPAEGDVFQPHVLKAIKFVTEKSWLLPRAIRVDSITNYQHVSATEDDLIVADLVGDPYAMSEADLVLAKEVALHEPFLAGRGISRDARTTGVSTTFQLPDEPGLVVPSIAAAARAIQAEAREQYPDIRFEISGTVMLNNSFIESAQGDMATLYPWMMVFLAVTMLIFLRSAFGALSAMIVVFLSATFAYGMVSWFGVAITSPSTIGYVIILTVAIADSIHVMITMLAQMRIGVGKREAISESLRINMQPVFLTTLTTAIGFLSLNFSDSPPLSDLGNICAIGATAAFFYSITLLPILLDLFPVKARKGVGRDRDFLLKIVDFVERHRVGVLVTTLALSVSSVLAIVVLKPEVNDKFVEFFSKDVDFRKASDFSMENLTGIYIVEFSIGAGESSGISDPGYLNRLDQFVDWIKAYPPSEATGGGIAHVNTFAYVPKRLNVSMHGGDRSYYEIPDDRQLAAQYLLMYEMSLPEGQDLNNQINVDKSSTRVTVTLGDVSSVYMRAFGSAATAWLEFNQPEHMHSQASGVTLIFSYLTERNVKAMIKGTLVAFLLISATLMISLRSIRMGLISLAPNMIPAVIVFGIWTIAYGKIGMYAAFVTATALGLIVDFTVHFLSKYLRARREKDLLPEGAVRYAITTVGSALWVSAFVLIVGFSALMFSDWLINALMGLLTAMIIAVALIIDFTFLPSLVLLFDREKEKDTDELVQQPA